MNIYLKKKGEEQEDDDAGRVSVQGNSFEASALR